MINAAVIGATGYTGIELIRLLKNHPEVQIKSITSQSFVGEQLADIYPTVRGQVSMNLEEMDFDSMLDDVDVIFLALPHGHSAEAALKAVEKKVKVIDLGADFRFRNVNEYEDWYKVKHPAAEICSRAVYGLPEIHEEAIKKADVIGNPGCYPTSVILGLAPVLAEGLIELTSIISDSKSGVSGAGRKPSLTSHYAEVNENINPYGVASHRHMPEIEQELSSLAGEDVKITLTPHLVPMTRGILSTIYAKLKNEAAEQELRRLYEDYYQGRRFVHLLPPGQWPHTKWVYGSNNCQINITLDQRTGRLIIMSVIDNLVKGASGQAVQNLNLIYGLPEETGLDFLAIYP